MAELRTTLKKGLLRTWIN
uniref:Uncharacterized protein n=1 Tax=Rhizophora mucronata TaxID=61149 RepID=A0A2P2NTC7_RHIMU